MYIEELITLLGISSNISNSKISLYSYMLLPFRVHERMTLHNKIIHNEDLSDYM